MAIYHLSAKVISRGKGQSAIAASAYRSGERLRDEQAGEQKFYTSRADRIQFTAIMAPADAPAWAQDRNALWNHAERAEKRKDAQLAREIEVSLPHELTDQQREWLVKDFAREAFVRKGYAVDIAIHAPDKRSDERNHHAHILVTRRTLGPEGFSAKKDWQFDKAQLGEWREQWAHLVNRHLERHGHAASVDHRSLKAQGVEREATMHLGYAAKEIDARGGQSDRMEVFKATVARNEIRAEMKAVDRDMAGFEGRQPAPASKPTKVAARAAPSTAPARDARTAAAGPAKGGEPQSIRVIGGIARPGLSRAAAGRPVGKAVKAAGKMLDSVATAFEGLLGGGAVKPSKGAARAEEAQPVDRGPGRALGEAVEQGRQLAEDDKSQRRQRYLRQFSREVPDGQQREADLERSHDPTTGRERTRGE